ncbi:MAG TPA: DUF883 domain-containing protein [Gammaproteobacteria bacterium]|jgi:ElaB/YqjD/DUF883 family membrane-anchored ribosome-binding protein|nr:DUF883 domain-containing protein [Gammaproteobacteria bacterium]
MSSNTPSQQSSRDRISAGKEQLSSDFKSVVSGGERLLGEAAAQGSENMTAVSAKVAERLASAERFVVEKSRATARATDAYVQENPWRSLLIASGISFLIGLVVTRALTPSKV